MFFVSATVVVSSTGGAAQHLGGRLGQYEYLEDKGYYVQSNTEDSRAVYLYPVKDDYWYIGPNPGEDRGWFFNPKSSKTPPARNWQYSDNETMQDDMTLSVIPGPLPPLPRHFMVRASGATAEILPSSYLGIFTMTQRWYNGRPVYVNTDGHLLHNGYGDYGWVIGPKLGELGLAGSRSRHSPASEESWRRVSQDGGSEWTPALVTVSATDVVISSTGGAAQTLGGILGQYEYIEDKGYYVQKSTEQSNEKFQAAYLYSNEDDKWWVGDTPGVERGWLRNLRPSKSPPTSGWQYTDKGTWNSDDTLSATPGSLPPLVRQFTLTATGAAAEKWPSYTGVFTRTERWWRGRPVYVNKEGRLLYHSATDEGWVIGHSLGKIVLRGSQARHSPANEDYWRYWTGSIWEPASVTVLATNVVISAYGYGARAEHGGVLGQFEYLTDKKYYVQKSTEQSNEKFEAAYLYPDKNDKWWVGKTPGEETGWLRNLRPSKSPPSSDWQYADEGTYHDDDRISVTPGLLPPLPRHFMVTASGDAAEKWPSHLGVFTLTDRWWNGRPVYVNTKGQFLSYGQVDDGWVIGSPLGYYALRNDAWAHHTHHPAKQGWSYWTGTEWKWSGSSVNVTVTSSQNEQKTKELISN